MRAFFRRRIGIGPTTPVYLLDMLQENGDHDFWAFSDPDWFAWAENGEGPPPRLLVKVAEGPPPPADADRNVRLSYVASGAFSVGEYLGRTEDVARSRLGDRRILAQLAGTQADI